MAQLSSFATTAANVVTNNDTRTITISNEVVNINGVLDPPTGSTDNWGGWTIVCTSSGGFRFIAGASGTLGGGVQSLKIIEESGAFRYRANNYQNGTGTYRPRFSGGSTTNVKVHNVFWLIQSATGSNGRSDFDIYRGSNNNGSQGPNIEFSGVFIHQLTQASVEPNHNHMAGNYNIVNHPVVGYGLRIRNETTAHVIEFTTPIQSGKKVEGLIIDNIASPTNHAGDSNARVTVQLNVVPSNGNFTLTDLNAPSITDVSGSSDKTLILVDPVGQPTITNNWGRHVQMEIQRTVPFSFTGASVPSGTTMNAIAQTSGGVNATSTFSGTSDSIVVRTQYANNSATSWTNQNTYQFFMASLGLRKYTLTTTQTISNTPSTITAAIIADVLPDGTAISTITSPTAQNPPDTLSELIRAIKDWEVANPTFAPNTPVAWIDGNAIKINTGYGIELDANASALIEIGPHLLHGNEVVVKCGSSMSSSNGLTTVDATGTNRLVRVDGVTEDSDVFLLDSTGQKTNVTITNQMGASVLFSLIKVSDGSNSGSATIASAGTGTISVATKGLGSGYKIVGKRPGYNYYSADVDLTGGGSRTLTAPVQSQILQPSGTGSYVSSVTVPATLTVAVSTTGTTPSSRIECGDATFSARQIFKAWEDEIASSDGARYMGLGGAQVTYIESVLKGNEIVLGAHTKVKRKSSTDANATVRATLYAPDDAPVDATNGDVQTIEGLNESALANEIWSSSTRTLTSGGGGGATAQQIWEYDTSDLTGDKAGAFLNTAKDDATAAKDDLANTTDGLGALKTAIDAVPTVTEIWGVSLSSATGNTAGAYLHNARDDSLAAKNDLANTTDGLGALKTAIEGSCMAPDAATVATAVWEKDLVVTTEVHTDITPIGIESSAFLYNQVDYDAFPNTPTQASFFNNGGYTTPAENTNYWFGKIDFGSSYYILPFSSATQAADPDNNLANYIRITGSGTRSNVVLRRTASTTVDHGEAQEVLTEIGSGGGSGGATAAQIWNYNTSSITGTKAGAFLNTARADATAAKNDLANSTDGLGALKSAIDTIDTNVDTINTNTNSLPSSNDVAGAVWSADSRTLTSSSSGGATAQQIWEYDTSSITGSKAGAVLNTAGADATAAKNDLANTTDGLGALKSAIDTIDGNVDTVNSNTDSIASDVWGASTRTLTTSAAPTTSEIADAVWNESITVSRVVIVPQGAFTGGNLAIPIRSETAAELNDGDPVKITNAGGATNLSAGMIVYIQKALDNILLYSDAALTNGINLSGGDYTQMRLTREESNYGTTARTLRNLTDNTSGINTSVSNLPSASAIADSVWAHSDVPASAATASEIADAVWEEIVDGSITGDLIVTPDSEAGSGLEIPATDFALIKSGDDCTFTDTGGYSGFNTTSTYYVFKSTANDTNIFFYDNKSDAEAGNGQYIPHGGDGTAGNIRISFPETNPIGTAGVALQRLRTSLGQLESDHTAHASATSAIGVLMNQLLGVNYIETGMSLQQAIQICTAVLAGRLSVANNGTRFTFHRLDSGSTAVIRSDTSETGRTDPTRDPS